MVLDGDDIPLLAYRFAHRTVGLLARRDDLSRHRAELRMGLHKNRELQQDWNAAGEDGFSFEVLDTVTPRDEPGFDVKRELQALEELWLERLAPYGDAGYNSPPK